MSRSSTRTTRNLRRLAVAATLTGLTISGSYGVFAGLNASAFNATPTAVSAGTLKLALSATSTSAGFTAPISNLVPGDSVSRYVTLVNSGSLPSQDMSLRVSSAVGDTAALLASSGTHKALQVSVQRCATPWTWSSSSSTCAAAGGAITIVNPTDVGALNASIPFYVKDGVRDAGMAAQESAYLKVTITLPDQNEVVENGALPAGSVQGGSANLTFNFAEVQPLASTSSN